MTKGQRKIDRNCNDAYIYLEEYQTAVSLQLVHCVLAEAIFTAECIQLIVVPLKRRDRPPLWYAHANVHYKCDSNDLDPRKT